MKSLPRLLEHQKTLLGKIATTAQKGDVSEVLALSKKLEMLASLLKRHQEEIDRTLADLEGDLSASPVTDAGAVEVLTDGDDRTLSAKERGRRRRDGFVQTLANMGVTFQWLKGAIFRSPRGVRVGVAYARESNKDKWFLGLAENQFAHAVLLCEESSGKMIHFSLPKEFMRDYGESLSRKNGQIKFNVFRRGGEFFLHLPRRESVTIEAFRDNYSGLI